MFQLEDSSSLNNGNISFGYINPEDGVMPPNFGAGTSTQHVTVNELDVFMWSSIQMVYSDVSLYPSQIGQLASGNVSPKQSLYLGDGTSFNVTLIPNYLKTVLHREVLTFRCGLAATIGQES